MIDPESIPKLLAAGTIEVAPLAYMRGRTLNDAFIILDEAQNTSPEQMKMFLTRLGFGSKIVVTGDVTQIDLPGGHEVGPARSSRSILDGVEDVVVQPAHRPRRGPAPAGRAASWRPTTSSTPAAAAGRAGRQGAAPVSIEVLNESGHELDVKRLAGAAPVRAGPDARPPAGRAVHQGRRRGHHRRAQRAVDGQGGPDRRAGLPDGRAAPGPGQRGARGGRPRRPGALPGGRRAPGRGRRARRPRPRSSCSPCTASCTCSATTTPSPRSTRRCSGSRPSCWSEWRRRERPEPPA